MKQMLHVKKNVKLFIVVIPSRRRSAGISTTGIYHRDSWSTVAPQMNNFTIHGSPSRHFRDHMFKALGVKRQIIKSQAETMVLTRHRDENCS